MSVERRAERLVRWYPTRWRERYGEELAGLIVEMSEGERLSWRLRADVAAAGARERLREAVTGDPRSGGPIVVRAWAVFALAGMIVAQSTQHWQSALPRGSHTVASGSFFALQALAVITTVLVVAGIVVAVPSFVGFLRAGGWPKVRRCLLTAAILTFLLAAATAALTTWAHDITPLARNGIDQRYNAAFVAWAVLGAATLLAWTRAATSIAKQLRLSHTTVRLHALLATAIATAMGVMTAATVAWWAAVAVRSPGALRGAPAASRASPIVPTLVAATTFMALATALATSGARRANAAE